MKKKTPARKSRQTDSATRWRTYAIMLACALLLVTGFFFAARQHFSSMDYGMKNSRLQKQIDDLEAEKRRLVLAREVSLSPAELKKAAKKTGLAIPEPAEPEIAQATSVTREKAAPPVKTAAAAPGGTSLVVKTAAVSPGPRTVAASYVRPEKAVRQEKKPMLAE